MAGMDATHARCQRSRLLLPGLEAELAQVLHVGLGDADLLAGELVGLAAGPSRLQNGGQSSGETVGVGRQKRHGPHTDKPLSRRYLIKYGDTPALRARASSDTGGDFPPPSPLPPYFATAPAFAAADVAADVAAAIICCTAGGTRI